MILKGLSGVGHHREKYMNSVILRRAKEVRCLLKV